MKHKMFFEKKTKYKFQIKGQLRLGVFVAFTFVYKSSQM